MKFLATIFLFGLLSLTALSQTPKPKPTPPKAKPSASKSKTPDSKAKATATHPKAVGTKTTSAVSKPKPAAAKPKATGSKTTSTAAKTNAAVTKPKTTNSKITASVPKPTATKPKTTSKTTTAASKPKPIVAQSKKPDENAEWEKATTVADGPERVTAVRKFIKTFPKSAKNTEAVALIVTVETQLGNDKLAVSDVPAAAELYRAAARDAPKPVPDKLFVETLSKIPANLYFRGARADAIEIAKTIEEKSDANVSQLLNISAFYMSIESGSEAKRLAENAIKLDPNSSAAYQTLGLANRMDFDLDQSAVAYAKALELEPDSLAARRGLAEMKRSLGKSDEAVALYREILAKDDANVPARTGLVLALFDAGKRADAEVEMAKSLEANSGNVILLASAAYWYAAHDEGDKAVELAGKAIATDPRFIWSHIAMARGFLSQKNPAAADKTLLIARRYGNFPTLEYEIASAKLAAGYYREAAEELAKSFSVKDGIVKVNLGGRVSREAANFTELVGFERRASIFAPVAADSVENAAKLAALLKLKQELDAPEPKAEAVAKAADDFVAGDDRAKVHRQLFAATQLLEKKVALPKVVEITKAATTNVDAGVDIPSASTMVMASELYENRSLALTRGEYLTVPDVPRPTLSSILRGEIEEVAGWALLQMDDPAGAAIRLKRAVSVLPVDSAWWRSSTWRLGTALAQSGKDAEALDMYVKSYKSSGQTPIRYNVIEALYKKINGTTDGLEAKIGPNPAPQQPVAQKVEPSPTPEIKAEPSPAATGIKTETIPPVVPAIVTVKETPMPEPTPIAAPEEVKPAVVPEALPTPETKPVIVPEASPKPSPEETKAVTVPEVIPKPTPEMKPVIIPEASQKPSAEETKSLVVPEVLPKPTPETKPVIVPEASPKPTPEVASEVQTTPDEKPQENTETKPSDKTKELFPPVIITIPAPVRVKAKPKENEAKPEPSPTPERKPDDAAKQAEIKPCTITLSDESITLQNSGSDLAVIVGVDAEGDVEGITAVPSSTADIRVRREPIAGVKARALFVVRSISDKAGVFQIKFELPCGKKDLLVKVL